MVDIEIGEVVNGIVNALSRIGRTLYTFFMKFKDLIIRMARLIWDFRKVIISWIKFVITMIYRKAKLVAYYLRPVISRAVKHYIDNPADILITYIVLSDIL